jgi:hypothetical protein
VSQGRERVKKGEGGCPWAKARCCVRGSRPLRRSAVNLVGTSWECIMEWQ